MMRGRWEGTCTVSPTRTSGLVSRSKRNYTLGSYKRFDNFGVPTPHDNEGNPTYKSLKWVTELLGEKAAPIVSKRVDEFRERTQPQLGKVHDPIKDTLNVPPDHTFGVLVKADKYGAGDLIHNRDRHNYLRGLERDRGIVAAIRAQLKKANYHNFHDLVAAFRFYDKTNSGQISIADLQEVLLKFNLPAEPEIVIQLMYYCDQSNTGFINYTEFSNFLNWKEQMPSGLVSDGRPADTPVDPLVPKEPPQPFEPERLQKQIDHAIGDHRTSASMINAVVGGIPTKGYRTYGTPTIRSDIPAPRIRRIDDHTNYGDGSDVLGLVSPSIYTAFGVYERDFLCPRPREQIREFFANVGVEMDSDTFQKIYVEAASRHPGCEVSIESFRMVMDEMQGIEIMRSNNEIL
ncbi:hypothetical protein NP493_13g06020 [Ridgeia piscesae]|uniref:EF-hand domain-containing protein n=1 Tax=Ridgeia piscesae TaxID=27915 RepID=A0AAD9UL80_RIDPI|nr:hypothetical protein NP493_13g06020 [Ridgeia piscesae]